ncbi:hypothetical protein FZC74_07055 [Sutcliffiella horikoshii]|uniref:Uncharacterized protein n=1 Tax=Sutcliffiella horikoshii TaxID=79883 RepID=A0AA94WRK9_9BACI|nr:hypothetical protein [Sutcliffiella horikoshii]TYS59907.1 hypothetical protein FZC74_07055 [Sutcliffiella horikoshii]
MSQDHYKADKDNLEVTPILEKLSKSSLADSIQKKDREFDEEMSKYDKKIQEMKNNIKGEGR